MTKLNNTHGITLAVATATIFSAMSTQPAQAKGVNAGKGKAFEVEVGIERPAVAADFIRTAITFHTGFR